MEKYKIKKLYNGFASVRDYIINKCLKNHKGIIIEFDNQTMTIPHSKLKTSQLHTKKFISKYNNKTYELIDFRWKPDKDSKQMELF